MGYSKELFQEADKIIKERKKNAEEDAQVRFENLSAIEPRFIEIKEELAQTGIGVVKAVLSNQNIDEYIEKLRLTNQKLQDERTLLLKKRGLSSDYFSVKYFCPICEDEGYIDGNMCECLKKELRLLSFKSLNINSNLSLCDFSSFNVNYYPSQNEENSKSPREKMNNVLKFCKNYANNFSEKSGNVLLFGKTGLGKTHLSLAIAKSVIEKGFGVIYVSAPNLMDSIEREKFSGNEPNTLNAALECDLLVLDDLGAEFSTPFVISAVYNIINSRINSRKATIISTNLDFKELETKYSERLVSRLLGEYTSLRFLGNDIRLIRKSEKRDMFE